MHCTVDGPLAPYQPEGGGSGGAFDPSSGTVSVDGVDKLAGSPPEGGRPGTYASVVVEGQVSAKVATVKVTSDGDTATVPAVHGTFFVRFLRGLGGPIPPGAPVATAQAYDAAGRLLGTDR